MKERKRRHDDAHYPLQGLGKRTTKRKSKSTGPVCECGLVAKGTTHLCNGPSVEDKNV